MRKSKLGHAFDTEIEKVFSPSKGRRYDSDSAQSWKEGLITSNAVDSSTVLLSPWRRIGLLTLFLIIFFGLFLRLFHLQIVQGSEWRDLADSNRIKIKIIHAPRGVIYDRNGKILAQNEPGFRLIEPDASSPGKLKTTLISRDEALKMEVENDPRFKDLEIDSIRSYPEGSSSAHVLGYLGEITDSELNSPKFSRYDPNSNPNGYKIGDQVGKDGVEEVYEKTLRGVDGGEIIEVDAQGNKIRTLSQIDPIPGQNLYLTIDSDLQAVLYKNLEKAVKDNGSCCGAAVSEDPKTGQILALVSYPSYDPKNLASALTTPNSPLLDRAIAGTYPPGSTFKIASALAGLSSGKITPSTIYEDTGVMNLGPYTFANWYFTQYGKKEGPVDIVKAIQRSNDIFFYHVGEDVGETYLGDTAKKLGLGQTLGIDLPGEATGLIPTDQWKEKNVGVAWYPGDTLHMAIGQGYVLATPLQILNMTSTIAADGKEYPLHLALKITSPTGRTIKQFKFNPLEIPFKSDQIALVKQGLQEVPLSGGTAWPFFTFPVKTAGKTGTAEFGDPKDRTHAWYTSYAPADNPRIALTVLVEAGGEGSNVSAPVAKETYRWYFSKDKSNLLKDITIAQSTQSAKTLGE